jgi:hypothetical protein
MAKINFKKVVDQVVQKAPGLVAGAVASNYIATGIDKMLGGRATPTITAGLTLVAGALLPGIMGSTGKKGQFMQSLADGIMTQGGLKLAKALNIPGISGTDGWDTLSGMDDSEASSPESLSGNND